MDIFNWTLLIIIILGFSIIIFSILKINKYNNAIPISDIDSSIKQIKNTIDQADLAIDDLNLMSEEIFKRFDEKQKQLLFLYESIEKKKMNVNNIDIKVDEKVINKDMYKNKKNIVLHPMSNKVLELANQNMTISDIAQILNMGQGEVELIINLGKDNI